MSLSQFSSATEGLELSAVEAFHDRLAGAVQLIADRLGARLRRLEADPRNYDYARATEAADLGLRMRSYERRMVRPSLR